MTAEAALRPVWADRLPDAVREKLECHLALLRRWNPAINLVARDSLADGWTRHVADSVQLFDLGRESAAHWADLGSGGGFPGLVIAIIAQELAPAMRVTLVEADRRKAEFLRTVSRETGVPVTVLDSRIEALPSLVADVVSARALAPLPALCALAAPHLALQGRALFPKGARAEEEIAAAQHDWGFRVERFPSATDPNATVLRLTELRHA